MSKSYSRQFVAQAEHIDELGHVNNAVWLQWVQQIATEHWTKVADPVHLATYIWVVTRHEIDYRGNVTEGESVTATTYIPDPPRGARFDRCVDFTDAAGKVLVSARSSWAMIDKASERLVRIRADVAAPFFTSTDIA